MREPWPRDNAALSPVAPAPPPGPWQPLIGEYALADDTPIRISERAGRLLLCSDTAGDDVLHAAGGDAFATEAPAVELVFGRDSEGQVVDVTAAGRVYRRRRLPDDPQAQVEIATARSLDVVLREARQASPPAETGDFLPSALTDLTTLDPLLRLDLRYAGRHNFLGARFYTRAIPLLQRDVASALQRVHAALRERGYGVIVLDAYRPWYVTRAFWDAMPENSRWLVANPEGGSRHNRGAAVDLTLYDLYSGDRVPMPSTFDEPSVRAYAHYPGGTSRQRWHRDLLRQTMEREGFAVNRYEWWHFDHADWARYRIENIEL